MVLLLVALLTHVKQNYGDFCNGRDVVAVAVVALL